MTGDNGPAPSDPAAVGFVVRPHGVAGELVIEPADPASVPCAPGEAVWLAGSWRVVEGARRNGARWLVRLAGVVDRDAAEKLRGKQLMIEAEGLEPLEDNRYYIHDLIGCRVEDIEGVELGEVVGVAPGPQDCLEVEHGGRRSLVPMVKALLVEVDVSGRRIVIDAPPGLAEATRA